MEGSSIFGGIINFLAIMLIAGLWIAVIARLVKNRCAPVKTVEAMVVDKYKTQTVSRIPGALKAERCIVVFLAEKKKLSFVVSEFSFQQGYRMNEKGTLKYKGNKILDFS